jgi:hypothetical protein
VRDDVVLAQSVLVGRGLPGLVAVDRVARLELLARRLGARVVCRELIPQLRDLLTLAGLDVEVQREPECREEPLGCQRGEKEVDPGDLGT